MSTFSAQEAKLSFTPMKSKTRQEFMDDCDYSSPPLKSRISATTIDSPLASPRKSIAIDVDLEED